MPDRPRLAMLHTAQSNVELFRAVEHRLPHTFSHTMRDDLLRRAADAGKLTDEVREETRALLRELQSDADMVLVTCSTLGPAADDLGNKNVVRIDRALAEAAVEDGGDVHVFCTVSSTLGPTRDLFEEVAGKSGRRIEVHLVEGAWPLFDAGDLDAYFRCIADAADENHRTGRVTVFGQLSMSPAASLCRQTRPMTSLSAAIALLGG